MPLHAEFFALHDDAFSQRPLGEFQLTETQAVAIGSELEPLGAALVVIPGFDVECDVGTAPRNVGSRRSQPLAQESLRGQVSLGTACREGVRPSSREMDSSVDRISRHLRGSVEPSGRMRASALDSVVCLKCRQVGNEAELLLCDGALEDEPCTAAYHTTCLGIQDVPTGEWFCPACEARRRGQPPPAWLAERQVEEVEARDREVPEKDDKDSDFDLEEEVRLQAVRSELDDLRALSQQRQKDLRKSGARSKSDVKPLNDGEKFGLQEKIDQFDDEQLDRAFKLLREDLGAIEDEDGEVNLDVDSLSPWKQRTFLLFVEEEYIKKKKKRRI